MKSHAGQPGPVCVPVIATARGLLPAAKRALCSIAACLFFLQSPIVSGSASSRFDEANRLYEQGQYSGAVAAYQELIREDQASAAVYFNLGNAWFKSGQTGRAIASYRLAQRLAPRDPDIKANLRFVRETVPARTGGTTRWERWLAFLTVNEATMIAAVALWAWLLLLAARQLRPQWTRTLRNYTLLTGAMAVLAGLWLALLLQNRLTHSSAVVVNRQAVIRYGPFVEAQSFQNLPDGAELTVINRKDGWLQVRDPSKRIGWVQTEDVHLLPRG